jgi:hypothetical protein
MLKSSDGVPLVVFHGTNFVFDKFELHHLGNSCSNPSTCFGFFFTESEQDAWSWAQRGSKRIGAPDSPRVIKANLQVENLLELSYTKFHFYLQRAKVSTMQRHMAEWIAAGYDGFTVIREGHRWYLPFDVSRIAIVGALEAKHIQMADSQASEQHQESRRPTMRM